MTVPDQPGNPAIKTTRSYAALRHAGYRAYFVGNALAMMADAIEHVISYWIIDQKFHSHALGGFAMISHWLPFLLFSVHAGVLADRFDPRRVIQMGMALFMIASAGWGILFLTGTLQMWHAVVILIIHGFAGVFWAPASQMLIHDIVGEKELQSGVRLMATGRMLGILMGPAIGVGLMELLGPARGILVNIFIYVPLVLWCWKAPYGRAVNKARVHAAAAITRLADILETIRMMAANPTLLSMTLITGFASFFVANAYQPQLPEFAQALGATRASAMYGMLFAANAAGAFTAGLVLESRSLLPARTNSVYVLVFIWCCAIIGFALSETYVLSVALLFCAGFVELSFSSMAQTLVQMNAPSAIRGRVIGVYFMSFLGLKSFSGVFVGFGGELIGVHWSLAISAAALLVCMVGLRVFDVGTKAVRVPGE